MPSPSTPPLLQAGQRLGGYQIVELVGRGGMGEVYRAKQLSMDREVALKVLSPRLAKLDPSFAERFVAEARAAGRLNHPNIVAVHDVATAPAPEGCTGVAAGDTINFFSMEFIEGETVRDVIERQGAIDAETVARVMGGMAEALGFAEAHRIIHRDIKPDNIILPVNGGAKLADLGLALQVDEAEALTAKDEDGATKVMGTPLYMAPEQAQAKPVDFRADQYALGATLFHMLVGRPPYSGEDARTIMRAHCFSPVPDPQEANPQVSPPWRELCMRLMAKAPDERFASSSELRGAVKAAVRWRPPHAPRAPSRQQGGPWLAIAAAIAVGGGAWVAYSLLQRPGPAGPTPPNRTVAPQRRPGQDPATPLDPADQAAAAQIRVRTELAHLPEDPDQAMRTVLRLLADPDLAPAKADLEQRRDALQKAADDRHRAPLNATLARGERAMDANRLAEARGALDQLPDEEWLRQRRDLLRSRLQTAEHAAEERLTAAIAAAAVPADCDRVRNDIDAAGLPDESHDALRARLGERLAVIKAALAELASQAAAATTRWSKLAERLESVRGTVLYGAFKEICTTTAADFSGDEQSQVRAMGATAELAQKAEESLKSYLAQNKPKADCRFGAWAGSAQIVGLDGKVIRYLAADKTELRADRTTAVVPWRQLLDDSAVSKNDPRANAAFLWYWRVPGGCTAVQRLGEDPLAKTLATYDRVTKPLPLAGEVLRREAGVTVVYPFAEARAPALLADWIGNGAELVSTGLHWTTSQQMRIGGTESDLPTLRWKSELKPPLSLEALVQCDPGTYTLMIGVASGNRLIRAALLPPVGRAVTVMTEDDGSRFAVTTPLPTISPLDKADVRNQKFVAAIPFDPLKPCRVRIEVDAGGTVALWLDDKPMLSKRPTVLPVGPISIVLQANQPANSTDRAGGSIPLLIVSGLP